MQNFFSYRLQVDRLPQQEQHYRLRADKEDCVKIREILKVPAVKSFSSDINLKFNQKEHRIRLWGRVEAELELESVISLELFDKKYETDFELEYDTEATLKSQRQEEEELSIEDNIPDVVINGTIDLADISIEQIALIMEDYPRKEGERFEFRSEFKEEENRKNPFEVLKKLK